ncbi:MAG: hypothetical protein ACTHJS_18035 [Xanthobacteraceae bacterium]
MATATATSMVGISQPFLYRLLDLFSLVLGLLPSSIAVVAVILIGVESQNGANQHRYNYYDCRSHWVTGISTCCTISTRVRIKKKDSDCHSVYEQQELAIDHPQIMLVSHRLPKDRNHHPKGP